MSADCGRLGFKDIGNCVYDGAGSVWVHQIEGCRVWQLDLAGRPLRVLGSGEPGFQAETVPFEEARFHWIYDLRLGRDMAGLFSRRPGGAERHLAGRPSEQSARAAL